MELSKEFIKDLLKAKKRGCYGALVEYYFDQIDPKKIQLSKMYVERDLEMSINLHSFRNAVKTYQFNLEANSSRRNAKKTDLPTVRKSKASISFDLPSPEIKNNETDNDTGFK